MSTITLNDKVRLKCKSVLLKKVRFETKDKIYYFYKTHAPIQLLQQPLNDTMEVSTKNFKLIQTNWSYSKLNFLQTKNEIQMENVKLLDSNYLDRTQHEFIIEGTCKVLNLSFEKTIKIRYTFDLWSSYEEIIADYVESIQSNWDRFKFNLPIKSSQHSIYFAIQYIVNQKEYWDNNHSQNYHILIESKEKEQKILKNKLLLRYDFSNSLSETTNKSNYTPFLFNHLDTTLIKSISIQPDSISTPINSYSDLINKYCFYNKQN